MYVPRPSNDAAETVGEKTSNSRIRAANESASCCNRCTTNQPRDPRHQQRPLEFTSDMVKDQELLVTTLTQQGISEALIRRQFNKLLEEQSKQLALEREIEQRPPPAAAKTNSDPRESSSDVTRKRSEPSSLLRLRMKKEMLEYRGRNNGLQDLATAAKIIDKSKSHSESSSSPHLRLNGTQDSGAPEAEAFCQAHCLRQPASGKARCSNVSANGLENSRNKKQLTPKVTQQQYQQQHQQQQQQQQQQYQQQHQQQQQQQQQQYQQQQQFCQPGGDVQHEPVTCNDEQQQQQQQQPHDNHSTFYPDIQEPRVFGGFTYFARKPQLGCLPQFAQPHPQPPNVNTTRSTTAF